MTNTVGYENDKCHFCGKKEAGYGREENGKTYDACIRCARKGEENANRREA